MQSSHSMSSYPAGTTLAQTRSVPAPSAVPPHMGDEQRHRSKPGTEHRAADRYSVVYTPAHLLFRLTALGLCLRLRCLLILIHLVLLQQCKASNGRQTPTSIQASCEQPQLAGAARAQARPSHSANQGRALQRHCSGPNPLQPGRCSGMAVAPTRPGFYSRIGRCSQGSAAALQRPQPGDCSGQASAIAAAGPAHRLVEVGVKAILRLALRLIPEA